MAASVLLATTVLLLLLFLQLPFTPNAADCGDDVKVFWKTVTHLNSANCTYHGTYTYDLYWRDTRGGASGRDYRCECNAGYRGATCAACDAPRAFAEYPACRRCTAARDCNGIGTVKSLGNQCVCECPAGASGGTCTRCAAAPFSFPSGVVCANDFPNCAPCFNAVNVPMVWTDESQLWKRTDKRCVAYAEQTERGLLIDVIEPLCNVSFELDTSLIAANTTQSWALTPAFVNGGSRLSLRLSIVVLHVNGSKGSANTTVDKPVHFTLDGPRLVVGTTPHSVEIVEMANVQKIESLRIDVYASDPTASLPPLDPKLSNIPTMTISVLGCQSLSDRPLVGDGPGACGFGGSTRTQRLQTSSLCPMATGMSLFNGNGGYNASVAFHLRLTSSLTTGHSMLRFLGQSGEHFSVLLTPISLFSNGVMQQALNLTLISSSSTKAQRLIVPFPSALVSIHVDPARSVCVVNRETDGIVCLAIRSMIAVRGTLGRHASTSLAVATLVVEILDVATEHRVLTYDDVAATVSDGSNNNNATNTTTDAYQEDVLDEHVNLDDGSLSCLRSMLDYAWTVHVNDCLFHRACRPVHSAAAVQDDYLRPPPSSSGGGDDVVLDIRYLYGNVSVLVVASPLGYLFDVRTYANVAMPLPLIDVLGCFSALLAYQPVRLVDDRFAFFDVNLLKAASMLHTEPPSQTEVYVAHMNAVSVVTTGNTMFMETSAASSYTLGQSVNHDDAMANDELLFLQRPIDTIAMAQQIRSAALSFVQGTPLPIDLSTDVDRALRDLTECTILYLDGIGNDLLAAASEGVGRVCRAMTVNSLVPSRINPFSGLVDMDYVASRMEDWKGSGLTNLDILNEIEELVSEALDMPQVVFGGFVQLFAAMFPAELAHHGYDVFQGSTSDRWPTDRWAGVAHDQWLSDVVETPLQSFRAKVFGGGDAAAGASSFMQLEPWERAVGSAVLAVIATGRVLAFDREAYVRTALALGAEALVSRTLSNEVLTMFGDEVLAKSFGSGGGGWAAIAATVSTSVLSGQTPSLAVAVSAAVSYGAYAVGTLCSPSALSMMCSAGFNFVAQQVVGAVYKGKRFYPGEYPSPTEVHAQYSKAYFAPGNTVPCASITPSDKNLVSPYNVHGMCRMRGTLQVVIRANEGYVAAVRDKNLDAVDFFIGAVGPSIALGVLNHTRFFATSGGHRLICGGIGDCIVISEGVHNYIHVGGRNATVQAISGGIAIDGGGPVLTTNILIHGNALTSDTNTVHLTDGINHSIRVDSSDPLSLHTTGRDTTMVRAGDALMQGVVRAKNAYLTLGSGEKDLELDVQEFGEVTTSGGSESIVLGGAASYVANLGVGDSKTVTHGGSSAARITSGGAQNYFSVTGTGPVMIFALNATTNYFELGPNNDIAYGAINGRNTFHCSRGMDMMFGGTGEQIIMCKEGDGIDVFVAQGCRIQISIETLRPFEIEASVNSRDTVVRYGTDSKLTILGCGPSEITVVSSQQTSLAQSTDATTAYMAAVQAFADISTLTSSVRNWPLPSPPTVSDLEFKLRTCKLVINTITTHCFKRRRSRFGGHYMVCSAVKSSTVRGTPLPDCILGNVWSESFYSQGGCDAILAGDGDDYALLGTCVGGSQFFDGGPGSQVVDVVNPTSPIFVRAGSGSGSHRITISGPGAVLIAGSHRGTMRVLLSSATDVHCVFYNTENTVSGRARTLVLVGTAAPRTAVSVTVTGQLFALLGGGPTSITASAALRSYIHVGTGTHNMQLSGGGGYNVSSEGPLFLRIEDGADHNVRGSDYSDEVVLSHVYGTIVVRGGWGSDTVCLDVAERPRQWLHLTIDETPDEAATPSNNTLLINLPQSVFLLDRVGADLVLASAPYRLVVVIKNAIVLNLVVKFSDTELRNVQITNGTNTPLSETQIIYGIPGVDSIMYIMDGKKVVWPGNAKKSIMCGCGVADVHVSPLAEGMTAICPCMPLNLYLYRCNRGNVFAESSTVTIYVKQELPPAAAAGYGATAALADNDCVEQQTSLVVVNGSSRIVFEASVDVDGIYHPVGKLDPVTGQQVISNLASPGPAFMSNDTFLSVSIPPFTLPNHVRCTGPFTKLLKNCQRIASSPTATIDRNSATPMLVALGGVCSIQDVDEVFSKGLTADLSFCTRSLVNVTRTNCQLLLGNDSIVVTTHGRCNIDAPSPKATTYLMLSGPVRFATGGLAVVSGSQHADIVIANAASRHVIFFGQEGLDVAVCPGQQGLLRFMDFTSSSLGASNRRPPPWLSTARSAKALFMETVDMRGTLQTVVGLPDVVSVPFTTNYSMVRSMLTQRSDGCYIAGCLLVDVLCSSLSRCDFKVLNSAPKAVELRAIRATIPYNAVVLDGVRDTDDDVLSCTASGASSDVLLLPNGSIVIDPTTCTDTISAFSLRCCDDGGLCASQAFQVSVACPLRLVISAMPNVLLLRGAQSPLFDLSSSVSILTARDVVVNLCVSVSSGVALSTNGQNCIQSSSAAALTAFVHNAMVEPCTALDCDGSSMSVFIVAETPCGCRRNETFVFAVLEAIPVLTVFLSHANVPFNVTGNVLSPNDVVRNNVSLVRSFGCTLKMNGDGTVVAKPTQSTLCHGVLCVTSPVLGWRYCGWLLQNGTLGPATPANANQTSIVVRITFVGRLQTLDEEALCSEIRNKLELPNVDVDVMSEQPYTDTSEGVVILSSPDMGAVWAASKRLQTIASVAVGDGGGSGNQSTAVVVFLEDTSHIARAPPRGLASAQVVVPRQSNASSFNIEDAKALVWSTLQPTTRSLAERRGMAAQEFLLLDQVIVHDLQTLNATAVMFYVSSYIGPTANDELASRRLMTAVAEGMVASGAPMHVEIFSAPTGTPTPTQGATTSNSQTQSRSFSNATDEVELTSTAISNATSTATHVPTESVARHEPSSDDPNTGGNDDGGVFTSPPAASSSGHPISSPMRIVSIAMMVVVVVLVL